MRDWLKSAVTGMTFAPGSNPLIPHLIGRGGKTLAEITIENGGLDVPLLSDGVIEGEVVDEHS